MNCALCEKPCVYDGDGPTLYISEVARRRWKLEHKLVHLECYRLEKAIRLYGDGPTISREEYI